MAKNDQSKPPRRPTRKRHLVGASLILVRNKWRWRAVFRAQGKQHTGPLRGSQEEAHADYLELRRVHAPKVGRAANLATLGGALEAHLEQRAELDSEHYQADHRSRAKFLLGAWPESTPLGRLELKHLQAFVDGAVRQGRSPNSVRKDVQLLRRLFDAASLTFPSGLKIPTAARPQTYYLEPDELIELVQQIRTWKGGLDKLGRRKVAPQQERDAALIMFLGCTGIRLGEFCRLTVDSFDEGRREVTVLNRKVRTPGGEAQVVPYGAHVDWAVRALIEGADEQGRIMAALTTANSVFRRWKDRLGLKHLNGRLLRHTEGTRALLDSGADLAATADRLRHRNVSTTVRYVHATHGRIRRSLEAQEKRWEESQDPDQPTD